MFPLVWRDTARQDMRDIIGYIAAHRPAAARRLAEAIRYTADRLPAHPYLHRPGGAPNTREAVIHPNYILIYRVTASTIESAGDHPRTPALLIAPPRQSRVVGRRSQRRRPCAPNPLAIS